MNLNETLAFVAVARAGSFTGAGRRLGTPKSTLSRQVARLEERMGAQLLTRTTRKLTLTEVGEAYYARCLHAIEQIEDAERVASDVSGKPRGTLRVSTSFDVGRDRLPRLIPEFCVAYPDIDLVINMTQRTVDLVAEGYDVALRGGVLKDSGLVARRLEPSALILCASPDYLERCGTPTSLEQLADHDGVLYGPLPNQPGWRLQGPDGMADIPLRSRIVGNEFGFVRKLLIAGLGIGVMLGPDARDDIEAGRLVRVLPDYGLEGGGLYVVYPGTHHLSPKVRVFVDFVVAHAGELY